ncbi:Unconventional myosin-XV [Liparis tanakae]|uniref:Unconventional myosin-XV n=1 Tax=Liparis tanakae TaxID=230148 RepID=A0A4Z2FR98_9TELE|nr:Unconventional myosin-XV [Liparis tanakae]
MLEVVSVLVGGCRHLCSPMPCRTQAYVRPPINYLMAHWSPELNLLNLPQNTNLRGASYRLPSYAVVSPQVQGSGPEQHWAQGPGFDNLGLQQDGDVWGAERVLPHGTVQNLNKWSMYRDGELLEPHSLMGQRQVGHEQGQWNLSREGEPQGPWYDKTYIGSILVSVNPYKMYNIYGTDMLLLYKGRALGENPPHLFAIANAAYSKMMDAKHNQSDGQEVASVVSAQEIRVVAELLQISPEGLQRAITYKVTETMRDKISTPLSVESAVDARDAVAKILYSLLFHWLTERINAQKPKMPIPEFTIRHFAGRVTYQVYKFLDKNYDQVRRDVLELFIQSKNKMVSNLFLAHAEVTGQQKGGPMRKSSTVTRRYQAPTVSNKFQQSLLELVEKMERCNPFFVRCIKPNNMKPGVFEDELVSSQLRHTGALETVRIRREGYPVRMPFYAFLFRYKSLVGLHEPPPANGEHCVTMLSKLCLLRPGVFHVGVTKLFLKEDVYQLLECKRERCRQLAALTLQRYTRMYFVRKRFKEFRRKIIGLQAQCRGVLTRSAASFFTLNGSNTCVF